MLTVRWTMGDWPGRRFHPQAFILLAYSVAWARHLFPDAQLVITTNSLNEVGADKVARICGEYGARQFASEPWLPDVVSYKKHGTSGHPNDRNTWWKLAPFRLAPEEHELVLDNDAILWRIPTPLRAWLDDGQTLLCAGDTTVTEWSSAHQSYGAYTQRMRADHPDLSFSSGIIGWPPGLTVLPHPLAAAKTRPHHYSTEQGFIAANWLLWPPARRQLIAWASVPAVNDHGQRITRRDRVWRECDGAHFSDHNIGRSTRFLDEFVDLLRITSTGKAPQRDLRPVALT